MPLGSARTKHPVRMPDPRYAQWHYSNASWCALYITHSRRSRLVLRGQEVLGRASRQSCSEDSSQKCGVSPSDLLLKSLWWLCSRSNQACQVYSVVMQRTILTNNPRILSSWVSCTNIIFSYTGFQLKEVIIRM